ncbi:unnamed protein product [Soboliphyme baturini]|uniref:MFS domain-containing protein n=1 Tax=Soboliphyme baturini TaxID=241478 RepID=A0A183INH5_9BILA|nr:unnamed protein product [Soboliphyme baturini]
MLFSAIYLGGLLSGLPAGWLADKYSPKLLVACCISVASIATLLTPILTLVGGYPAMFIIRVITGIAGQACILPCIASMTALWIPPNERSTVIAFYTSGNQLASIIGMPLNAALCDNRAIFDGWTSIFYVNGKIDDEHVPKKLNISAHPGLISLIVLVLWMFIVSNSPGTSSIISEKERLYIQSTLASQNVRNRKIKFKKVPWKKLIFCPPMLTAIYCSCLTGIMTTTLSSFLPIYFRSVLFLSLSSNGILNSLPYISQLVVKMIMSVIADRLNKCSKLSSTVICKIFNSIGTFGPAIFLVALSFMNCSTKVLAVAFLVLTNALFAGTVPGYLTSMVSFAPRYTGTVNSIGRFCGQVASVITPYAIGTITYNVSATEIQSWVDECASTGAKVSVVSPRQKAVSNVKPPTPGDTFSLQPGNSQYGTIICQKL